MTQPTHLYRLKTGKSYLADPHYADLIAQAAERHAARAHFASLSPERQAQLRAEWQ